MVMILERVVREGAEEDVPFAHAPISPTDVDTLCIRIHVFEGDGPGSLDR